LKKYLTTWTYNILNLTITSQLTISQIWQKKLMVVYSNNLYSWFNKKIDFMDSKVWGWNGGRGWKEGPNGYFVNLSNVIDNCKTIAED